MRRVVAALIIAGTALVPSSAGAQEEAQTSLVQRTITVAEESLGDQATIAVLRAADRGYDLLQLIEGVTETTIAVDGTITDDSGVLIAPTLAPAGVIEEKGAAGVSGPVGGTARAADGTARATGATSGEQIGLELLETGIRKAEKRLDKRDDLGERAAQYDASIDVFTMLSVLVLIDEGYSAEQIILDGIMARGIDVGFDGSVVILDDEGKVLRPGGDKPSFGDDVETANVINTFMDDLTDAVTGEDPLAVSDNSFKRQYTVTIEVTFSDDEGGTGTLKGKANIGELKGLDGKIGGRGTGTLLVENKIGCSVGEGTKYPYSVTAPVRLGIFGNGKPGKDMAMQFAVVATESATVTGDESALCIEVVQDTADFYAQLITFPTVSLTLRDGEQASGDNKGSGEPFQTKATIQVKEI